jgi:hypothetical protein
MKKLIIIFLQVLCFSVCFNISVPTFAAINLAEDEINGILGTMTKDIIYRNMLEGQEYLVTEEMFMGYIMEKGKFSIVLTGGDNPDVVIEYKNGTFEKREIKIEVKFRSDRYKGWSKVIMSLSPTIYTKYRKDEVVKKELDIWTKEIDEWYKKTNPHKSSPVKVSEVIKIGDETNLFIVEPYTDEPIEEFDLILAENNKKHKLNRVFYSQNGDYWGSEPVVFFDYIYVDRLNKKVYFNTYYENFKFKGLICYDIKSKSEEKISVQTRDDRYGTFAPMRLPNTQYLIYGEYRASKIKVIAKEIPEWKTEIEKQKENEKKYPSAKKYFIDGPANVKDKLKGKNIVMLDDWIEVLVLEQKGDWYEILYADVRGWTYKDNLKDIKKF